MKALELTIAQKVPQIAVFISATETFNQNNIGRTIDESLQECTHMFERAKAHGMFIRGYVSMSFSCPYSPGATGNIATEKVVDLFHRMGIKTGIDEQALTTASEYAKSLL